MIYHGMLSLLPRHLFHSCLFRVRVEKYRPVYLDDIVGNTETIERLKIIAKDGNMPHVIISGMPGIGKTTSILCLARQLLGDAYKEAVLELNASDERGMRSRFILTKLSPKLIPTPRYRRRPQPHKRLRSEKSDSSARATKTCYPRRGRQHDLWCPTSFTPHDGDLLLDHPLRLRVQCFQQDHRAPSISLCYPTLRPSDRYTSCVSPDADL